MNNHSGKKKEIKPCETLYLSNVPSNSCTIPALFNHFRSYGHIQSIYAFGTNASITFSSLEGAIAAFKSPEAFANNRFVRYHYDLHPDNARDRLSLIVETEHVKSVLDEVKRNIAQQQRRTIELQSQLKSSSQQSESSSQLDNSSKIDDISAYKPQIINKLKELRAELKTAAPNRKIQIQREIEENEKLQREIDSLVQKNK